LIRRRQGSPPDLQSPAANELSLKPKKLKTTPFVPGIFGLAAFTLIPLLVVIAS